jgi:hypothetical protein
MILIGSIPAGSTHVPANPMRVSKNGKGEVKKDQFQSGTKK